MARVAKLWTRIRAWAAMHRFHHWRVLIEDAHDERTIARLVRDYRLTLPPAMVESLPFQCRNSLDSSDIPSAAMALLEADSKFDGAPEVAAVLHEVAQTYAAMAIKLATWKRASGGW